MIVTKEEIIEALKTEPLAPGDWCSVSSEWYERQLTDASTPSATMQDCKVCAVGAIFRSKLSPTVTVFRVKSHIGQLMSGSYNSTLRFAQDELDSGNYLAALSCVFEDGENCTPPTIEERRDRSIKFVEEKFPPTIDIDFNGLMG